MGAEWAYHWEGVEKHSDQNFGTSMEITEGMLLTNINDNVIFLHVVSGWRQVVHSCLCSYCDFQNQDNSLPQSNFRNSEIHEEMGKGLSSVG